MSLHDNDITARVSRFLDRKAMPRRLDGKPMAQDDEMRALIEIITRQAPRNLDALNKWWPIFEGHLSEACGDFWPAEKMIKPAAQKATQEAPKATVATQVLDMSDTAINARRMKAGEAVGEGYLWGSMAVEMIAKGLIDEATMRSYRSGAFLCRKQAYGEAAALEWEAEAKARHDAARIVWKAREEGPANRQVDLPDMGADRHHPIAAE